MSPSEFVGVGGCKAGWFSVGLDRSSGYEMKVFGGFTKLLSYYQNAALVLVDIPVGLPEGPEGRECDRATRTLLGKRRSSVFPTPTRLTVYKAAESPADYARAAEVERRVAGKGISKQAFAIAPKIAEVDRVLAARGEDAAPKAREVHPELCFWAFSGNQAMRCGKKTSQGYDERRNLLQRVEPQATDIIDKAMGKYLRKHVAKDDILDALAAAVTAREGSVRGALRAIPPDPPIDSKGLPMEMVYLGKDEERH